MKPFQGIITNWSKVPLGAEHGLGFRIGGLCLSHEDKPASDPHKAALRTTIEEGRPMFTSYAVAMQDMDGFHIVETLNSRYILIGENKA